MQQVPDRTTIALKAVADAADRFHVLQTDTLTARKAMDVAVHQAKLAGATYQEIAEATGYSISWVQDALAREGYRPAERVRRR